MKYKISLLVFILSIFTLPGFSQIVDPVKWSIEVTPEDNNHGTVTVTAVIDAAYHIYGMEKVSDGPVPTSIHLSGTDGITFDGEIKPSRAPMRVNDSFFDLILTEWTGTVSFSRKYHLANGVSGANITADIKYMACSNKSCLPPADIKISTSVGDVKTVTAADSTSETAKQSVSHTGKTDEKSISDADLWAPVKMEKADFETDTNSMSGWKLFFFGFLGGLLALLTPCVWPMIPMTLSFFMKKTRSRARSIADALTYGLSIIVIFLILGIAITLLFGAGKLNEIATSAVFNLIFFALLVLFAISFFGAFDIKLPSKWSNAMDNKAETTSGLLSIFFMAFTLVLVSFSCTGPIIGTLLVEAASDGSKIGPALGMGGFALGLALPFSMFAFFPSLLKEMPKSGGWMNSVKVVLGFIELILSLKFLSVADLAYGWRILDREVFIALWIVLFVLLGLYLLGKLRFSHDSDSPRTSVGGFFMAVASFAFAVYLLPGMWGAPLKAVSAFAPPLNTMDFNLYGGAFREFDDYESGMTYARENHKPVILDFSGYACVNCRKMEGAVFDTDAVRNVIENDYVLIKLMVDDKQPLDTPYTVEENGKTVKIETVGDKWSYLQRHKFNINSQPYYVLLNDEGQPLAPARVYDENVDAFVEWLKQGLKNYNEKK